MADENSSSVAIVAIIIIVIIGGIAVYFFSNGFQFNKSPTTLVQPTNVQNVVPQGETKANTETTTTTETTKQ